MNRNDPKAVVIRTVINTLIVAVDFVPVIGELFSWSADGWKVLVRLAGRFDLDLTPDVSIAVAVGTELAEFISPVMPTHIIEAVLQLRADWPRLRSIWAK